MPRLLTLHHDAASAIGSRLCKLVLCLSTVDPVYTASQACMVKTCNSAIVAPAGRVLICCTPHPHLPALHAISLLVIEAFKKSIFMTHCNIAIGRAQQRTHLAIHQLVFHEDACSHGCKAKVTAHTIHLYVCLQRCTQNTRTSVSGWLQTFCDDDSSSCETAAAVLDLHSW